MVSHVSKQLCSALLFFVNEILLKYPGFRYKYCNVQQRTSSLTADVKPLFELLSRKFVIIMDSKHTHYFYNWHPTKCILGNLV